MDAIEFAKLYSRHQHWLEKDCEGWEDMQLKLDGENLTGIELNEYNLSDSVMTNCIFDYAQIIGTDFSNAILCRSSFDCVQSAGCCFYKAKMEDCSLAHSKFIKTIFTKTDLKSTNMSGTDFMHSIFDEAYLGNANCSKAGFFLASFVGANVYKTIFINANLDNADFKDILMLDNILYLAGASMNGAKNLPSFEFSMACPSDGAFIGWKKLTYWEDMKSEWYGRKVLIKLLIPEDAQRCSATTKKCRCSKAKVLGFYDLDGNEITDIVKLINTHYTKCEYVKGEWIYPDGFEADRWKECSNGIHFFINKIDAINY